MSKPMKSLPSLKGLPFVGNLFTLMASGGLSDKTHLYFQRNWEKLGPLYRDKIGRYEAVFVHDTEDIKAVLRQEGKYPRRIEFPAWKMHREKSRFVPGILLQ